MFGFFPVSVLPEWIVLLRTDEPGGVAVVIRGIGGSPVCPPRNYPLLFANVLLLHTTTTNYYRMSSFITRIVLEEEAIFTNLLPAEGQLPSLK